MEHHYVTIQEDAGISHMAIFQRDNNLDQFDNLDEIPAVPAIYMICGSVHGKPSNPRYVGESKDLREAIKKHFDQGEPVPDSLACFKQFVLSIKTKQLVYQLMPDSSVEERKMKRNEWETRYSPKCNEEMNRIH